MKHFGLIILFIMSGVQLVFSQGDNLFDDSYLHDS